jgi:hypothetical protein
MAFVELQPTLENLQKFQGICGMACVKDDFVSKNAGDTRQKFFVDEEKEYSLAVSIIHTPNFGGWLVQKMGWNGVITDENAIDGLITFIRQWARDNKVDMVVAKEYKRLAKTSAIRAVLEKLPEFVSVEETDYYWLYKFKGLEGVVE